MMYSLKYALFRCKIMVCIVSTNFVFVCSSVGQSFKAKDNLVGLNVIGGYNNTNGFVGSIPVFYEHGTGLLGERIGIGGYGSFYIGENRRNDLTLGGRVALHPFKTDKWDIHVNTGIGYGFSLAGNSSDNGFRVDPMLGIRYYVSNHVGIEFVTGRYGRGGIQIGLGINGKL